MSTLMAVCSSGRQKINEDNTVGQDIKSAKEIKSEKKKKTKKKSMRQSREVGSVGAKRWSK